MYRASAAIPAALFAVFLDPSLAHATPLKVFISVDLEGIDGVVHAEQVGAQGAEFSRSRRLMAEEVNSAIDGALAAGATEIYVNDSHGTHRNLQIEDLHPPARLASSTFKPWGMMQGLDASFAAVIFIGYHARAGSPTGVLAHTGSGAVADLRVNGTRVGESGINTLYAASYGVPVVMLTGDDVAIAQARELTPDLESVEVKQAIGTRAAVFRPLQEVRNEIRATSEHALRHLAAHHIPALKPPFTFEVTFTSATQADLAEGIPTLQRTGPATVTYTIADYRAGYRLVRLLYAFLGGSLEAGYPAKP